MTICGINPWLLLPDCWLFSSKPAPGVSRLSPELRSRSSEDLESHCLAAFCLCRLFSKACKFEKKIIFEIFDRFVRWFHELLFDKSTNFFNISFGGRIFYRNQNTLRSQIEGYTRLLIFRKFSTLPAVIWASPFINFQENFQSPCFSPTQMKNFPPSPLLLEPPRLLNLKKNSSLPFY